MSAASRASIERALLHHAAARRIRGWQRHPDSGSSWIAELNGGGSTVLRNLREAGILCDALASAERTEPAPAAPGKESFAADAEVIRKALAVVERYRGGWYSMIAELGDLIADLDKTAAGE